MLRRHLPAIAAITRAPSLEYRVRRYFDLDSSPLIASCRHAGLSQADLVLCLVRIGTPRARVIVESLINKPIHIAPACRLTWSYNKQEPSVRRQPMITRVMDMRGVPLRRGTRLALCYPEFKCGRTLQQLQMRGVSRGDIRRAVKRGWISVVGV
jgi:hypothetical protein